MSRPNRQTCLHFKKNGLRCKGLVHPFDEYCYRHRMLHRGPSNNQVATLVTSLTPGAHIVGDRVLYIRVINDTIPQELRVEFHRQIQNLIEKTTHELYYLYARHLPRGN